MAPDPVPRSTMTSGDPGDRARPRTTARATSTSCSVSGRGIRTRRSTSRSSSRKAQWPSTYCSGSPAPRRSTIASSRATARSVAGSSNPRAHSAPSSPLASWHSQRASVPSPTRSAVSNSSSRQVGHGVGARELASPLVGHQRLDHLVQVAREHVLELVEREADAVVRNPVLLEVVGADLLAAPAPSHLGPPLGRLHRRPLVLLGLEQPGPQHGHRPGPVLELAALVLHGHRDPVGRWVMRTAESVVLTPCPPGPDAAVDVDLQVVRDRCRPPPPRPRAARARWPTRCGCGPSSP